MGEAERGRAAFHGIRVQERNAEKPKEVRHAPGPDIWTEHVWRDGGGVVTEVSRTGVTAAFVVRNQPRLTAAVGNLRSIYQRQRGRQ